MITEKAESRSFHYTRDGEDITQVFIATWEDIENGGDGNILLPVIGLPWMHQKPDVCVTDIRIDPVPGSNTNATFVATYSTGGQRWPEYQAESVASVKQVFDFQSNPGVSDGYYDFGTQQTESWEKIYTTSFKATHGDVAPDSIPPRITEAATLVMTVTGRVNQWSWTTITNGIGTINVNPFIHLYTDRYVIDSQGLSTTVEAIGLPPDYDDRGKWLFAGFRAESVGRDTLANDLQPNYEITSTFIWEGWGWNNIYNVTGYKAYDTSSFFSLPRPIEHSTKFKEVGR